MFLSDGKRVVYTAHEQGRPFRGWIQDVNGGAPRPLTPEGLVAGFVSYDDKWTLANDVGTHFFIVSIEDGKMTPLPGIRKEDTVLGWSADDQLFSSLPAA